MAKIILRKNILGRITVPKIKAYYIATKIECGIGRVIDFIVVVQSLSRV